MSKDLYFSVLLDFYGNLLNQRQYTIMKAYYDEDLSLSEIAYNLQISKQGVRYIIKRAEKRLIESDAKLGFFQKEKEKEEEYAAILALIEKAEKALDDSDCKNTKKTLVKIKKLILKISKH